MTYWIQQLFIGIVVVMNLIIFYWMFVGIYRLVSSGPDDLSTSLSLFVGLIGSYTIWKAVRILVIGDTANKIRSESFLRTEILMIHILFWGGTWVLWYEMLPLCSRGHYESGIHAKEQRQYADAIDQLNRALYQESNNINAHYALADIFTELADIDSAVVHYRIGVLSDHAYHPRAFNNLARLLLIGGDTIGALDLLDLAEERISKTSADEQWAQTGIIEKNRAWAYWKLGLYSLAMKHIVLAQKFLGAAHGLSDIPEIYCLHALIAKHTGDSKPAEQACLSSYESYQADLSNKKHQGSTARPAQGATRELYLLVLKQMVND